MESNLLKLSEGQAQYLTNRYNYVSSEELVQSYLDAGFNLTSQAKAHLSIPQKRNNEKLEAFTTRVNRYESRIDKQKHWITLTNETMGFSEGRYELKITNAYDGTSSLVGQLNALRLVCMNGLVANREVFSFKIPHTSKNIVERAIEESYGIVAKIGLANEQIEMMKAKVLNQNEKEEFVKRIMDIRFNGEAPVLANPLRLLRPKRYEERVDNLWQNFNTAQEYAVRGAKILVMEDDRLIERSIRQLRSTVSADEFNSQAWKTAMEFAA